MFLLTPDPAANAAKRTRQLRPRVRRITDTEIAVSCRNPDHPNGHVTRFERRADGSLWGECFLRSTGEACPAALGKRTCYHLAAGRELFLYLERERAAEEERDGQVELEAIFGGPVELAPPKPITAPRITVRELPTPAGTVRDTRIRGIQF